MIAKRGARDPREILVKDSRPQEEILDEVYKKFAHSDPFLPITHFIDHTTMGSEALVGLGLGGEVRAWAARHRVRPYVPRARGLSLVSSWEDALGKPDCHGDWLRQFESELQNSHYGDVLRFWVPRFAPAVGAFLFHGLIRTAHAVRALDQSDSPSRRAELARGLALWAIGINTRSGGGAEDASESVLRYARAGAAAFLAYPNIPRLHLVTGPMAYDMIAHHLDSATHRTASASFRETHAEALREYDALRRRTAPEPLPLLDEKHFAALIKTSDAHPIKLTEAALRAFEKTGDEIFLHAAGKAGSLHSLRGALGVVKSMFTRRAA